jgi:ribosomal protein L31
MAFYARTLAVAAIVAVASTASADGCPFCNAGRQTLTQEASQAALILFGTPCKSTFDPNATFQGTTELQIDVVIKSHPFINGKKIVTINRYIPIDKEKPQKYLVFCDVYKDKLDPYMGMPLDANSKVAEYLKGALEVKEKDATSRLAFFFKFLDNTDMSLSDDAFQEFANADYKDYRPLAEKLDPDVLTKWLKDVNTPVSRFGLYGSLLGHCGKEKHAKVLRELLDDPNKRFSTGIDGMLAGYVMLNPKEGWGYIRDVFSDAKKEFLFRYAALRAARFMVDFRPDLVSKDDVAASVATMLPQDDIADLVIEDLRKWQRWEMTDKVLGLSELKTHEAPIIRRAILRFAIQSAEKNPKASQYVAAQRKLNADDVKDVEELLQLESAPKPKAAPSTARRAGATPPSK